MCDMVSLSGTAKYLNEHKESFHSEDCSLVYELKTTKENICMSNKELMTQENISFESFKNNASLTHVVVGIHWGANAIAQFKSNKSNENNSPIVSGNLALKIQKWVNQKINGKSAVNISEEENEELGEISINFDADVKSEEKLPQTPEEVIRFIQQIPTLVMESNDGKGY